jgi:hypothetical protein
MRLSIWQRSTERLKNYGEGTIAGEHTFTRARLKASAHVELTDVAVRAANLSVPKQESIRIVSECRHGQLHIVQIGASAIESLGRANDIESQLLPIALEYDPGDIA